MVEVTFVEAGSGSLRSCRCLTLGFQLQEVAHFRSDRVVWLSLRLSGVEKRIQGPIAKIALLIHSSPRLSEIAEMRTVRFGLEHVGKRLLVVHTESLLLRELHAFRHFLILNQLSKVACLLPH